MKRHALLRLSLAASLTLCVANRARAEVKHWSDVEADHLWSVPQRWTPFGVPTAADDAFLGFVPFNDWEVDANFNVAEAASISMKAGIELHSELGVVIGSQLSIATNLADDPRASGLTLFFGSDLTVGSPLTPGEPSIRLTGGSFLRLSEASSPSSVSSAGRVLVDGLSSISGRGVLVLAGGIDLDGTLRAGLGGSTLELDTTSAPMVSLVDLDGSHEMGVLDASEDGATLIVPSEMADAFSGEILLGDDGMLTFSGTSDVVIDGELTVHSASGSVQAAVQTANALVFDESARYNHLASRRTLTIAAGDLDVRGFFDLTDSELTVTTASPWRLQGTARCNGGTAVLHGSELVVGSALGGPAFVDAVEPFVFDAPVVLERSARVRAGVNRSGASSRLTFEGHLTLDSPDFNSVFGPWEPGAPSVAAPIRIHGDLTVEGSTTLYASATTLGEAGAGPTSYVILDDQTLTLDVRSVSTEASVFVFIEPGAELDVVVRDTTASPWTNNMSIALSNGTLRTGAFCNQGSITGTGTVHGTLVASIGTTACAGTIAPGLSPGELTIDGDAAFEGTTFEMEIAGTSDGDFDRVLVDGDLLVAGGVLRIHFLEGFVPRQGDAFLLFSASGDFLASFASVEVTGLPPGYELDTEMLEGTGMVRVASQHRPCRGGHRSHRKRKLHPSWWW